MAHLWGQCLEAA